MAVDKAALEAAKSAKDEAMRLYEEAIQNCEEAQNDALEQFESGAIDQESYEALVDAIKEDKRLAKSEKDAAMRVFRAAVKAANTKGGKKPKASAESEPTV